MPEVIKTATLKVPEKLKQNDFSLDSDSENDEGIITSTQASEYDEKAAAIHALG